MGLKLNSSSGSITLEAQNTAGDTTVTIPSSTGTVLMTDGDGSNLSGIDTGANAALSNLSGVTGTSGQIMTSDGSGNATMQDAPAGGAWAVKSSGNLSGASQLAITGLTKTVKVILSLISDNAGGYTGPAVKTSTDGGTSYDAASTDYAYTMDWVNAAGFNYDQQDNYGRIKCQVQNEGVSWNRGDMEITLVDPQESTGATSIDIVWQHIRDSLADSDAIRHGRTSGYRKTNTASNACLITFGTTCNGTYTVLELN